LRKGGKRSIKVRKPERRKEHHMPQGNPRTGKIATAKKDQPQPQNRMQEGEKGQEGENVLHMHTAHAGFPVPYVTPDDMKANAQEVAARLPATPKRDLVFYGGLAALTVAGALEWPIAAAVGGATYVLRGRRKKEPETREAGTRPSAAP
jgi:hypothetical protein